MLAKRVVVVAVATVAGLAMPCFGLEATTNAAPSQPASAQAPAQLQSDRALAMQVGEMEMYGTPRLPGRTWVQVGSQVYGASADAQGPVGGGDKYKAVITSATLTVATLDELLAALARAKAGDVVFVAAGSRIDCTERVVAEQLVIQIPAGVTLAGDRGHGGSPGAMIFSDAFGTGPLIRAAGDNVRVTGLRIRGPDPKRRLEHHRRSYEQGLGDGYYYKFPISYGLATEHDGLEVDNCELAGFGHSAVRLDAGQDHRVHHNVIHHCQRAGLGYGIFLDRATARISFNLFDWNRHSIAGTGAPGSGYEADHNVQLEHSLSHHFDMHGGKDRRDGTDIAGEWMKVHHNTFLGSMQTVRIRGTPQRKAEIRYNWFGQSSSSEVVWSKGRTEVRDNAFGPEGQSFMAP